MAGKDVVRDGSRRATGWVGLVFGMIFSGVGTVLAGVSLLGAGGDVDVDSTPNLVPVFVPFGGVFALVGAWVAVSGARKVWLSHVLGTPTLTVPHSEPLLLGGVHVARFERTGGSRRARVSPRLSAELVCTERVTYRRGTDDHTVTHELYRQELATTVDPAPGTVAGEVVVEVPAQAPPSITLRHNAVVWSVLVHVRVEGVADDTGSFVVQVRPALAARVLDAPTEDHASGEPR